MSRAATTRTVGDQITERGIGNGISLIITIGIVARLPAEVTGADVKCLAELTGSLKPARDPGGARPPHARDAPAWPRPAR